MVDAGSVLVDDVVQNRTRLDSTLPSFRHTRRTYIDEERESEIGGEMLNIQVEIKCRRDRRRIGPAATGTV